LSPGAPNDRRFGDRRNLFDGAIHLRNQAPQGQMIVAGAVKCESQYWNIIDGARLDERR
jgi:hypothetical protein